MKYYSIPNNAYAMEIQSHDSHTAMEEFALQMDPDMNAYFRAVTEEEYYRIYGSSQKDTEDSPVSLVPDDSQVSLKAAPVPVENSKIILSKDAKEAEKIEIELKRARNRALSLINDAKARYIKEKTRARSKKLALEKDAIINSVMFDDLKDYDRREDIQEAYGCDCFDEQERDRLEDLWDKREEIKNQSVDGIYQDKVTIALHEAQLSIADLWEEDIEQAEILQKAYQLQQRESEKSLAAHLAAHNNAINDILR